MTEKLSSRQIVKRALDWGIESMYEMILGTDQKDPNRIRLESEIKQMRAYRKRRFGDPVDRFKDCVAVDIRDLPRAVGPERKTDGQ